MNVDIYIDEQLTAFPGIYCAHCGKTIKDAANANLIFKESCIERKPWIRHGIYTVHKSCDRAFAGNNPCGKNERYSWIGLDSALYMLLRNCRYEPIAAQRRAGPYA